MGADDYKKRPWQTSHWSQCDGTVVAEAAPSPPRRRIQIVGVATGDSRAADWPTRRNGTPPLRKMGVSDWLQSRQ